MDDTVSPPSSGKGPSKLRFQAILDEGTRVSGKNLAVVALADKAVGEIGIATPRSMGCHARRNRQKRRLRALVRNLKPPPEGMDLVVLARLSVVTTSSADLAIELQSLIETCRKRLTAE